MCENRKERADEKKEELERTQEENDQIKEMGQVLLDNNEKKHRVELLTIIGEVEGHDWYPPSS